MTAKISEKGREKELHRRIRSGGLDAILGVKPDQTLTFKQLSWGFGVTMRSVRLSKWPNGN